GGLVTEIGKTLAIPECADQLFVDSPYATQDSAVSSPMRGAGVLRSRLVRTPDRQSKSRIESSFASRASHLCEFPPREPPHELRIQCQPALHIQGSQALVGIDKFACDRGLLVENCHTVYEYRLVAWPKLVVRARSVARDFAAHARVSRSSQGDSQQSQWWLIYIDL